MIELNYTFLKTERGRERNTDMKKNISREKGMDIFRYGFGEFMTLNIFLPNLSGKSKAVELYSFL